MLWVKKGHIPSLAYGYPWPIHAKTDHFFLTKTISLPKPRDVNLSKHLFGDVAARKMGTLLLLALSGVGCAKSSPWISIGSGVGDEVCSMNLDIKVESNSLELADIAAREKNMFCHQSNPRQPSWFSWFLMARNCLPRTQTANHKAIPKSSEPQRTLNQAWPWPSMMHACRKVFSECSVSWLLLGGLS